MAVLAKTADEAHEALRQLWEEWVETYQRLNPPPEKPAAMAQGLHWTVQAMLVAAFALAVGVSIRTAQAFHSAAVASGASWFWAWLETAAVVLGVEGGMAAFGFRHAYRMALDGKATDTHYARFLTLARWGGLVLLVAVSVAAGLWQALALDANLAAARKQVLLWLAGLMGAGMSVAVFLLFEFAGAEAALGIVLHERRMRRWQEEMRQWREAMRAAFERRPAVRKLQALASGTKAVGVVAAEASTGALPAANPPSRRSPALERALQWLHERGGADGMSVREFAQAAGVSVGTAQRALRLWRANGDDQAEG